MNFLSIETSCDETSCALLKDGCKVLSNVIASQVNLHAKTGGVVPEVAAREHVLKIIPVLDECLRKGGCDWDDIDGIAVTKGPGLISSLIIGTEAASVISYVKNKPLVAVHHIVGHIYSNWIDREEFDIEFPVLVLTVSGGHNELILMSGHNDFEVLGETRDDAAGEAFDKVARILGLGYPGGPVISKIAEDGDSGRFKLPRAYLEKGSLDFSFSGLKTAVLTEVKEYSKKRGFKDETDLDFKFKADLAASFQEAVVEVLADKLVMAVKKVNKHGEKDGFFVKEIHLAGGVSANLRLREVIQKKLAEFEKNSGRSLKFRYPKSFEFCTDNAAMIGAAGYYLWKLAPAQYKVCSNIVPSTSFEIV